MKLNISVNLSYKAAQPCNLLLQIGAASDESQRVLTENLVIASDPETHLLDGDENVGHRIWVRAQDQFICDYRVAVEITRDIADISQLQKTPLSVLPSDAVKYLMPSRYCHPERFFEITGTQFGHLSGGAMIMAMSSWIKENFTYDAGASDFQTTAHDSLDVRRGVCRDYAHVLIAMARAVAVPARIVSAYAPDVVPQDFHAVVEVFLEGEWRLVDPTNMASANEIVRVGVGRDAADISFLTSYGFVVMQRQSVEVTRA